jgi:predicted nucleic acid-binding protein
MKRTKLYLDVCCYNRPFDDQRADTIRLEAEAVIRIINHVQMNEYEVVGSEVIDYEIELMDNPLKKGKVKELSRIWKQRVEVAEAVIERAAEISLLGFGAYDALHLSCAEKGRVDVFLTTDKRLLRSAEKHREELAVRVANPLAWLMGEEEE